MNKSAQSQKGSPRFAGEAGAIMPLLVVGLLLIGIFVATGLVQVPQIFKPKASGVGVQFSGKNVQTDYDGKKYTNDIFVEVAINSPFGGDAGPYKRGSQSVEEKKDSLRNRVLLPLWEQFNLVKPAFAMTPSPFPQFQRVLSGWNSLTPLPRGFTQGGAVVGGDYIFVGGGWQQDLNQKEVMSTAMYSAKINEDGAIGEWRSDLPALPAESAANNRMRYFSGYIYLVGGENETRTTPNVYSAKIGAGGEIGEWKQVGALPVGVSRHGLVTGNSNLYVIGGYDEYNPTVRSSKVFTARLGSEGEVGEWKETTSLPEGLSSSGVIDIYTAEGPYIYVAGGWNGKVSSNKVYSAKVNSDGSLGEWKEVSSLRGGLSRPSMIADRGYLIIAGGDMTYEDKRYPQSSVYAAKVYPDGSLGDWEIQDYLPNALTGSSIVSNNLSGNKRDLFMIGGYTYAGAPDSFIDLPNVYHAKLLTEANSPVPSPAPIALNVRLSGCVGTSSDDGKRSDSAMIEWDEVEGAGGYQLVVQDLTQNAKNPNVQTTMATPVMPETKYQLNVIAGDVYDVSVHTPFSKASNPQVEHIAVVCGSTKEGTAAYRYSDSKDSLVKTSFKLYYGPFVFPYLLEYSFDPQFIFAEFTNFKNESKVTTDSITYNGPVPNDTPPPTLDPYPATPIPGSSCPPSPTCAPGTVGVSATTQRNNCPTAYTCVPAPGTMSPPSNGVVSCSPSGATTFSWSPASSTGQSVINYTVRINKEPISDWSPETSSGDEAVQAGNVTSISRQLAAGTNYGWSVQAGFDNGSTSQTTNMGTFTCN